VRLSVFSNVARGAGGFVLAVFPLKQHCRTQAEGNGVAASGADINGDVGAVLGV